MGIAGTASSTRAHRGNVVVADGLLVVLVTAVALGALIYRTLEGPELPAGHIRFDAANVLAVALLLAGLLSLISRPPVALLVLVMSSTAFIASDLLGSASPLLAFAPLMALYAVAANSRAALSGIAAGVLALGAVIVFLANPGPLDDDFLDYLLAVATAWLLGYGIRLNRARTSLLDDQAVQLAREQATRTQEEIKREQARIARELHDIVAHHVVVIVAQAGAAKRVFGADSEQAKHALDSIETLGREALTEMRRLLGVLWTHEEGPKTPQPGLKQLPALVAQMEQAGLPVKLTVRGEPATLPAGVELNAYRIVQEALTNTLKHAGPTRADVELAYLAGFLELRVRDEGRGSANGPPKPGHGLVSMRQRALVLGGEVTMGPRPDRGFEVTARLPVNGERV